nr:contact-dependent growth inhibition system immunity protein [Streptomyces sp. SID4985]
MGFFHQDWIYDAETAADVVAKHLASAPDEDALAVRRDADALVRALSSRTLEALWTAGTQYLPGFARITGAEWTRTVAALCDARLSGTAEVPPLTGADIEDGGPQRDAVIALVGRLGFLTPEVREALTACARHCTADLAFRILLRTVVNDSTASLSPDQYGDMEAIGEGLQYGEFVVDSVRFLVAENQREARFWRHEEDFGLSRLAEGAEFPAGDADELHVLCADARLLLESPLSDEDVRGLWSAASGGGDDPGPRTRDWLSGVVSAARAAGEPERYGNPPLVTVNEQAMRRVVLAEARGVGPAPLERVVGEVDADLGFRLFLRVLKARGVMVSVRRYDRYQEIAEGFGYPGRLVAEGLAVSWPRFDDPSAGRRFAEDFGFSLLAGRFHGDLWQHAYTVEDGIRGAAGDRTGTVPGSYAFALLEDTLRLARSPLSDDTLAGLWRVATARGYEVARPREWLRGVGDVCAGLLPEPVPDVLPARPPAGATDAVLRELRDIAPALTRGIHDSPWYGASTSPWFALAETAVPALEQVTAHVGPDLGFRLLLRVLIAYGVPVTEAQSARYAEIATALGHPRYDLSDLPRH